MTDLTVGLAIVGGVALAAVVAHGAWQARKAGPRRAAPAVETPTATQLEPVLHDPAGHANAALSPRAGLRRVNPRLDETRLDRRVARLHRGLLASLRQTRRPCTMHAQAHQHQPGQDCQGEGQGAHRRRLAVKPPAPS